MIKLNVVNVSMRKINKKKLINFIVLIIILFIYYLLARFKIFAIPCPIKYIFHVYCPGCGVSRMLIALTKFQINKAFNYNQLAFILLPFLLLLLCDYIIGYLFDKPMRIINKIPTWIYVLLAIIVISFGIIRNIPGFEYLTPRG